MRYLINYIREAFCKHDWLVEETKNCTVETPVRDKTGTKVYMRCRRCGYHQKHWKH